MEEKLNTRQEIYNYYSWMKKKDNKKYLVNVLAASNYKGGKN